MGNLRRSDQPVFDCIFGFRPPFKTLISQFLARKSVRFSREGGNWSISDVIWVVYLPLREWARRRGFVTSTVSSQTIFPHFPSSADSLKAPSYITFSGSSFLALSFIIISHLLLSVIIYYYSSIKKIIICLKIWTFPRFSLWIRSMQKYQENKRKKKRIKGACGCDRKCTLKRIAERNLFVWNYTEDLQCNTTLRKEGGGRKEGRGEYSAYIRRPLSHGNVFSFEVIKRHRIFTMQYWSASRLFSKNFFFLFHDNGETHCVCS